MSRLPDPRAKIALLRAAEEVFAERGLAGAKVEDIAKRAGVSKGAFYLHFESKEAALKHIVESFLARCGSFFVPPEAWQEALPDSPGEVLDFTLARDLRVFEFLWESRDVLRILPSCQGEYEYLFAAFRAEVTHSSKLWVEHWKREELFRADVDAELASTLLAGAYNELVAKMLAAREAKPPIESWLLFAQGSFVRAFGAPVLVEALEERHGGTTPVPARLRRPRAPTTHTHHPRGRT